MMPDYLFNNKTEKFFAKYRVYASIFCKFTHSFNLFSFSLFVFSRQTILSFINTDLMSDTKPFSEQVNQSSINIVDA